MSLSSSKGYTSSFRGAVAPGAFHQVLTGDFGTVQNSLPSVSANSTYDYVVVVPNSGSQWRNQGSVGFARPDQITETVGISVTTVDCMNPLYPGTSQSVTGYALYSASNSIAQYMVMNGYLYQATTSGTTASTFIGGGAFNQTKGATTTDGSVVWTSLGKASIIAMRFANSTTGSLTPTAMEYDFWAA